MEGLPTFSCFGSLPFSINGKVSTKIPIPTFNSYLAPKVRNYEVRSVKNRTGSTDQILRQISMCLKRCLIAL